MNIFDLDGTLRNVSGSEHLMPSGISRYSNRAWVKWQKYINQHGRPIAKNIQIFRKTSQPIILTSSLFGTEKWCAKHGLTPFKVIEREMENELEPFAYKKQFIDQHKDAICLWVDDHALVCQYARQQGIETVFVG